MRAFFTGSLSGSLVTVPSIAARFDEGVAADGFWARVPPTNRINQHAKTNFMEMDGWESLCLTPSFYRAHPQRQSLIRRPISGIHRAADLDGYVKVGGQCGDDRLRPSASRSEAGMNLR